MRLFNFGVFTAGVALAKPTVLHPPAVRPGSPLVFNETALVADGISSCSNTWMAIADVTIGNGTDKRTGYTTAVNKFCNMVDGMTVASQDYLSMATEVFLDAGKSPSTYGLIGYVYFEIHNKLSTVHKVTAASCKTYLGKLSAANSACYGATNSDTKGGTYQVGTNGVSYHALGQTVPPNQNALNKLLKTTVLTAQSVNKGSGAPLNPWPLDSLNEVLPVSCHSHNDYDRNIPVFQALNAGCTGMEADVWLFAGDLIIGHILPTIGRTLRAQYVNPLKAIIDHNGGYVYKTRPNQTLMLLIDFKTSETGTLDAVVTALQPLRQAGYLSQLVNGKLVKKGITVVASGNAPFDRISTGDGVPDRDIFYDANLGALDGTRYTSQNSYLASADFQDVVGQAPTANLSTAQMATIRNEVGKAHSKGLVARYWNLPGEYVWESLAALGVDFLNADNLYNTARLARIS
ncbi:hypothetical protein GGR50DRAFT_704314 [Xylaria sp. CBS 124048]|nr:hypothetical protein GGR50DRAFT_704314 [Xylaria sp. CBS 124048]